MFRRTRVFAVACLVVVGGAHARAQDACHAPEPVCAARDAVFVVQSFDPFASAVRIAPDLLVTNRHVIADSETVQIRTGSGTVEGTVVPTGYDGDLVLLRVAGLAEGPVLSPEAASATSDLYTVAADVGREAVRVYPPGRLLLPRADTPHARLHHGAYGQVGNSGGALVDSAGRLVGIVASGGEGRYEAIAAEELARLQEVSGAGFAEESRAVGEAVRQCAEALESQGPAQRFMSDEKAKLIVDSCLASRNRQYFDLAAQALGLARQVDESIVLSEAAVARDPHAINSRLILVTTLHIAGRYAEELPHLRFLLDAVPAEPSVARFAIQAGKWGGDQALAQRALELLKQHNPAQAEAAERFLAADAPPPQRQSPGPAAVPAQ